jgi:leucyl aminopeptidase (aminopeptidase T)
VVNSNAVPSEFYSAPVSATGTIYFDHPRKLGNELIKGYRLRYVGGRVVDFEVDATTSEAGRAAVARMLKEVGMDAMGELAMGGNDQLIKVLEEEPFVSLEPSVKRALQRLIDENVGLAEKKAGTYHSANGYAHMVTLNIGETRAEAVGHEDFVTSAAGLQLLGWESEGAAPVVLRNGNTWTPEFERRLKELK